MNGKQVALVFVVVMVVLAWVSECSRSHVAAPSPSVQKELIR